MKGYTGKILNVDLSTRTWHEENLADEIYEKYLSGIGLGAYILLQRLPPKIDPLGPKNILGFVAGILSGTGAMFAGRWMVVGKSPLTGGWGDANCGGNFGPALKWSGYDGIIFEGTAPEPVWLKIIDGKAELCDAARLWGKTVPETEDLIQEEMGQRCTIAS